MQSVEFSEVEELDKSLKKLLEEIPVARKELHEGIANILKNEVDKGINTSGLNDNNGKVKEWQESVVGSGGGYAAVHAESGITGNNSPGAITNYLENGHKIRQPSGKSKHYRPRIKKSYVNGYHFYQSASKTAESIALSYTEDFVETIKNQLEGNK